MYLGHSHEAVLRLRGDLYPASVLGLDTVFVRLSSVPHRHASNCQGR